METDAESLNAIRNVLNGPQCYAICEKHGERAIGSIELRQNGHTNLSNKTDECDLGYWLGKPFWGRGYMPEAAEALLCYGFEALGMTAVWCAYYEGNAKSKRVQEKLGFAYHHTCEKMAVSLMNEVRICHINLLTRKKWAAHIAQNPSIPSCKCTGTPQSGTTA